MLSLLIKQELIRLKVPAKDWQDAVRKSGLILLNAGYILPDYIGAMIETIEEAGPYVVIAKHIAMPHAKPSNGVLREGISILTLASPVEFGNEENDPVKYVFCLSSVNSSNHLNLMKSFVELLDDEGFFELLDKTESPEDVFNYILQFDRQGGD